MFDIGRGELGILAIVALIVNAPNFVSARWS
jgi:Sec-independent protein translocase protein TatA